VRYEPDLIRWPSTSSGLMESAYRRLKREIVELERLPGTAFTEQSVAQALGLSKTPVREALARLHQDGLVRPLPRTGYIVSPVTLGDAVDLCDLRGVLQSEASAMCATQGLSPDQQERLAELVDDTPRGPLVGSVLERRMRENYEFEAIIANGAANHRLAALVANLFDDLERVVRLSLQLDPSIAPQRISERQAVVDAILARDPEGARAAMRMRTDSAKRETLRKLSSSNSITSASIVVPEIQT